MSLMSDFSIIASRSQASRSSLITPNILKHRLLESTTSPILDKLFPSNNQDRLEETEDNFNKLSEEDQNTILMKKKETRTLSREILSSLII